MSVTPKAHSCECKNLRFMEVYELGLGDFDEEFVERRHQNLDSLFGLYMCVTSKLSTISLNS